MEHGNIRGARREWTPGPENGRGSIYVLRGLPVYPRVDVAFSPSEMLSYPVGGEFPFPPFLAYCALRDSEYCGYLARRKHAVRAA
jgi:hypothetical protein